MTLGSLFSGSGSFELAGVLSGITPVFASEIEPYPIAVTTSRFPNMKHLGSVTEVHGDEAEPVDVLTVSSPCQDLSIAGKQAGLVDGKRSSLFFDSIRIIKEMRESTHGRYPQFVVFENVPGLFAVNKGEDFRTLLQSFIALCDDTVSVPQPPKGKWLHAGEILGDHYSLAWRV